MSIKQDYKAAFDEICKNQREIVFSLFEMMKGISDKRLSNRIGEICNTQVSIYNATKKYFDSLKEDFSDQREESRENILGLINFQEANMEDVGVGKCLDLSAHGARIKFENYENITKGERFKLWIRAFGGSDSLRRNAIVEWVNELEDNSYLCGVRFQP